MTMARLGPCMYLGELRSGERQSLSDVKSLLDLSHYSTSTRLERMAGDWAQLKQRRAAKDRTATPAPPPPRRERLDSWISNALPPTLAVEHIPGRGRGLVAPNGAKAGTTLLATAPLVSVLDARNLPQRCSHCFRSGDDFDDSHSPKLLQCSLCHTLQYCSSVPLQISLSLFALRALSLTWTLAQGRPVKPQTGRSTRRNAPPSELRSSGARRAGRSISCRTRRYERSLGYSGRLSSQLEKTWSAKPLIVVLLAAR